MARHRLTDHQALGRSRESLTTKIHVLCDGHGHPLHFHPTAGLAHETTGVLPLLEVADEELVDGLGKPWPGPWPWLESRGTVPTGLTRFCWAWASRR